MIHEKCKKLTKFKIFNSKFQSIILKIVLKHIRSHFFIQANLILPLNWKFLLIFLQTLETELFPANLNLVQRMKDFLLFSSMRLENQSCESLHPFAPQDHITYYKWTKLLTSDPKPLYDKLQATDCCTLPLHYIVQPQSQLVSQL